MAKIPLPERGQPIDVSYIAQITNAINELSDALINTGYNYTTVNGTDIQTANARIIARTINVSPGSSQTADKTVPFTFAYNLNFKSTPVATATIVNTGRTDAGDAATVILTDINANSISGLVRFQKTGNVTADVNVIVIGIPN
jgi:hypothetical protein